MNAVWVVIRREYLQRIRTKWFLVSTIGGPIFLLAAMLLPGFFAARTEEARRTLAVVDETGILFERVRARLEEGGFTLVPAPEGPDREARLEEEIRDGGLGGYLILDEETLSRGRVVFRGEQGPGTIRGLGIRQAVVQAALEARLGATGSDVDVAGLLRGGELEVRLLDGAEGEGNRDVEFATAFVGALLLYMVILLYAVSVMRAVLEEKTGRIVEILVSCIRPWELMLGKVLGVGSVGLTQLAVWVLFGGALLTLGLPALAASRPELLSSEVLGQVVPGAGLALLFVSLFVLGYFLYAALYAAVGAMCSSEEEAQQAQFPVIMLLVIPVIFLVPMIEAPNSALSTGLSLFPFFSPILMYARAATGSVPAWQVGLSLVLLVATILGVAWAAGRVYRVGILMQGKRPTLRELARWLREA